MAEEQEREQSQQEADCPVSVDPWAGVDVALLPPVLASAATAFMDALDTIARVVADREVDGAAAQVLSALLSAGSGRASAVAARVLSVVEADGLWAASGTGSFAHWVATEHTVGVATARAQVRLGRALRDHLPLTARAVAVGTITAEHAKILAQLGPTTEQRRQVLADPDHPCNEAFLVEQAQRVGVDEWRLLMRRWAAASDPDADDRGYVEACERQHLQLARLGDMYDVAGKLTVETGQALSAALAAFTPARAVGDDRTPGQRRAHALGDLARVGLHAATTGKGRPIRPKVNVLVDYGTFVAIVAGARARGRQGALGDDGPVRSSSFATPDVVLGGPGAGGPQYEDGARITRAELDLAACDCAVARYVFGPDSEVLDVGRTQRTFTGARREALVARDKHCRYPGCTAPPIICQGHHIDEWARDHGRTDVKRGILLCTFHHGHVHRRHITIARRGRRFVFSDRHGREITGDNARVIRRM